MRRWFISVLLAVSIAMDQHRFGCESFLLSPSPIRTLLVDSAKTVWNKRNSIKQSSSSHSRRNNNGMSATKGDETWSKTGQGRGSRLGVRRRVRNVLDKARKRTGVTNDSEEEDSFNAGGRFISETASMGLFDDKGADIVFSTPTQTNGVSATYPRNDTAPPLVLEPPSERLQASQSNGVSVAKGYESTVQNSEATSSFTLDDKRPTKSNGVQVDALLQSEPEVEPLPFALPTLSHDQKKALFAGERLQEQSKMGREGSGYVVMDIPAPPYAIWECLLDFEAYPKNIGTVRSMRMFTNTHLKQSYISEKPVPPGTGMETRHYGMASISRAAFTLSKFRLKIAAIHRYQPHPDGHYMVFTLDKACTNVVLQDAKGIWYTQENPDGREGYTRVWLLCELKVSPMLPTFIVDYAANRAMPRATTWLPIVVEEFCQNWFGPGRPRKLPKD